MVSLISQSARSHVSLSLLSVQTSFTALLDRGSTRRCEAATRIQATGKLSDYGAFPAAGRRTQTPQPSPVYGKYLCVNAFTLALPILAKNDTFPQGGGG